MSGVCYKGHDRHTSPSGQVYCPVCRKDYKQRNKELIKSRIHPLFPRYQRMLSRCYNPNDRKYPIYGDRGIRVCDRWLGDDGFLHFVEDLYPSWKPGLSLDRYPNRNGNYDLNNVRWATAKEQNNNRRDNRLFRESVLDTDLINCEGNTLSIGDFSIQNDIPSIVIRYRYARNDDVSLLLQNDILNRDYPYKNHNYTSTELSFISGLDQRLLTKRIDKLGWPVELAVETPVIEKFSYKRDSSTTSFGYDPDSFPTDDLYGRMIDNFTCEDVAEASDNAGYYPISATLYSDDPDISDDDLYCVRKTREYILNKILKDTDRDPTCIDSPRG